MKRTFALALFLAGCSSEPSGPQTSSVEADLEVSPATGTALTDFRFDAGGSVAHSDGARGLEFRWDWEGDGIWDSGWSAASAVTHRFETLAGPTVVVEARQDGFTDQASVSVSVNLNHGALVTSLQVERLITPRDLAFDGTQFWLLGYGESHQDSLFRIHPSDGTVEAHYAPPSSWPNGIAWDGSNLWISDNTIPGENTHIFQLANGTGLVLWSFPVEFANRHTGLSFGGGAFFHGGSPGSSAGDDLIHAYDAEGVELRAFTAPAGTAGPRSLAHDGETLWVTGYGSELIFQVDAESGALLRSLEIPGHLHAPVVVNGHLWLPFIEEFEGEDRLFLRKFVP